MLRRISLTLLVLLGAGLLVAGWYAYNKGFTQKWRRFVSEEFRKRGTEVTLRRLTFEPSRGILAKDVKVFETRRHKRTLAVIDEVRLVINYANLFQGKPFIEALDLRDADLDIPLDPRRPGGPKLEVRHLSGRLFLPPQQVYLSRLQAECYGVRVTASGRLINPEAFTSNRPRQEVEARARLAEQIIGELKKLKFEAAPPALDVRFSGDLTAPEQLFIEGTLWAEKVSRHHYLAESLYVNATFRDGVLNVRQLVARDASGALRASVRYEPATRTVAAQLHSELDAQALLRPWIKIPELEETVFYAPPAIEATVRATFDGEPRFHVLGHLALEKFAFKSVIFDSLAADFSWDDLRWAARDVRVAHRTGEITGDALELPHEFRTSLRSTADRQALAPLLTGRTGKYFQRVEFVRTAPPAATPDSTAQKRRLNQRAAR